MSLWNWLVNKRYGSSIKARRSSKTRRLSRFSRPTVERLESRTLLTSYSPAVPQVVVDFREITYFDGHDVLTSSDATIRANNSISGDFDPNVWPYDPLGGTNTTPSRGDLFRIYGFQSTAENQVIHDADNSALTYTVTADNDISGAYYIGSVSRGWGGSGQSCAERREFGANGTTGLPVLYGVMAP